MTLLSQDQIVKMSIPELEKEIQKTSLAIRNLKMQLRSHQNQDHKTLVEAKKNRSRMLTELNNKKQNN